MVNWVLIPQWVWMVVLWCALYVQAVLWIHWLTTASLASVGVMCSPGTVCLRDGLYNTFHQAGLATHLEVGCGWRVDKLRTRPADILVTTGMEVHLLLLMSLGIPHNSSLIVEVGVSSGVAAHGNRMH